MIGIRGRPRPEPQKIVRLSLRSKSEALEAGRSDISSFIQTRLRLAPAPTLPEIRLYAAHPGSGLRRLEDDEGGGDAPPPYWAYLWAGGAALARHILDSPGIVQGRRVLDLGAGSGVVGIAAAKAGASSVVAVDVDPNAVAAIGLNAAANGVVVAAQCADLLGDAPGAFDIVAVGDLFYEPSLASRVTRFLEFCLASGVKIYVGDPGRVDLPRARLRPLASYPSRDFGETEGGSDRQSGVYAFESDTD